MMNHVLRLVVLITCGMSSVSAYADPAYLGEWVPTSTTSISITGSMNIEKDRIVFDGHREMRIANKRHRDVMDELRGPLTLDKFDIQGPVVIEGLNGNTFKRDYRNVILMQTDGQNELRIYMCTDEELEKNGPIRIDVFGLCDSYSYKRQNIS